MKNIAFVPARSRSTSIPQKNIKLFCGKPLIYWCLASLQKSQHIDSIIVATDSNRIALTVDTFNFSKISIYRRKKENATPTSSTESVMLEYLEAKPLANDDNFLLVQATSPFTTYKNFDEALSLYNSSKSESLLSCALVKRFFWDKNNNPINYNPRHRPRRQDFGGSFVENGALYINKVENIIKYKNRLSGKISIYEMPDFTAIELDEEDDWLIGEALMKKYVLKEKYEKYIGEIKLFLSDVDGVLTDAGMYYTEQGDELKKFSTYDGVGFKLLQKEGIKTGIITSEDRALNQRRAEKLELDYCLQDVKDKLNIVKELCKKLNISLNEVAYIGDDINCMTLLENVGMAACPANAIPEIKNIPGILHIEKRGGEGAVREFSYFILMKE